MTFKDQNHFLNYICFIFIHLANKPFQTTVKTPDVVHFQFLEVEIMHFVMDRKVWKYYQKSYKREKLQNSMKLVSTVSPSNFEHRLRTSLEGIATSSLAHAKNKSGRLEIRNIANVNTRQMKTRSQRNFCYKKHDFVQKNRRPLRTWNDKKSAILKDTIKNVFKLLLWSTHVNYIWVYFFFNLKEFAIFKQIVD